MNHRTFYEPAVSNVEWHLYFQYICQILWPHFMLGLAYSGLLRCNFYFLFDISGMLPVHWIRVKSLHLGCELVRFRSSHVCGKSYSITILFLNDLYTFTQDMLLFKTSRWNTRVFGCIFKVQTALKVWQGKNGHHKMVMFNGNETNNILTYVYCMIYHLFLGLS